MLITKGILFTKAIMPWRDYPLPINLNVEPWQWLSVLDVLPEPDASDPFKEYEVKYPDGHTRRFCISANADGSLQWVTPVFKDDGSLDYLYGQPMPECWRWVQGADGADFSEDRRQFDEADRRRI